MTEVVKVALFGLGRAGSIHLNNILSNYRFRIAYIVEFLVEKAKSEVNRRGLENAIEVLHSDDAEKVFHDKTYDNKTSKIDFR